MSAVSAPGAAAPNAWLGGFRAWMQAWSSTGPAARTDAAVRVLVADDEPVNLLVISAQLESRGLVPLLAADGAEAVALACEMRLDLILMDMQMPILDGLGAAAAIRRFEAGVSRPAVPMLAYSSACPTVAVLAAHGINGSLAKPCGEQDLERCLIRWCPGYQRGVRSFGDAPLE